MTNEPIVVCRRLACTAGPPVAIFSRESVPDPSRLKLDVAVRNTAGWSRRLAEQLDATMSREVDHRNNARAFGLVTNSASDAAALRRMQAELARHGVGEAVNVGVAMANRLTDELRAQGSTKTALALHMFAGRIATELHRKAAGVLEKDLGGRLTDAATFELGKPGDKGSTLVLVLGHPQGVWTQTLAEMHDEAAAARGHKPLSMRSTQLIRAAEMLLRGEGFVGVRFQARF